MWTVEGRTECLLRVKRPPRPPKLMQPTAPSPYAMDAKPLLPALLHLAVPATRPLSPPFMASDGRGSSRDAAAGAMGKAGKNTRPSSDPSFCDRVWSRSPARSFVIQKALDVGVIVCHHSPKAPIYTLIVSHHSPTAPIYTLIVSHHSPKAPIYTLIVSHHSPKAPIYMFIVSHLYQIKP
ncbi:hypothetical protein E2C01_007040 [Portunus trituberculatus]|uniref:Uncharacterized protein n=1 Tax=Portunus trituberculatus TaxID=210409 RepID=A0A5B7CYD4_PORTR|nr:hypothetical protein [Portunus trituberculatus]